MDRTRPRRSLKSRVTGLHIAILFSAAFWFGLFKLMHAHTFANGVVWFALIVIIMLECFLALSHARRRAKPEKQIDVIAD